MRLSKLLSGVLIGAITVLLASVSASGVITFERTYGGTSWDNGYSVQQTEDGGYIVAGWTRSFGAGRTDVYLIKTDSLGDTLWTRTYGGTDFDGGYSVRHTQDKGYIIAGWTESFGSGRADVYLIKTDSLGDTLWTRTYGGTSWDEGHSVQQTADRGYVIAGETKLYGQYPDVYLVKTDSSGETEWTRTYGGPRSDFGYSVQQTRDGGYIIAGETWSFGAGENDVYLIKTDSSGDTLWTKTYGSTSQDQGQSVQQTSEGGYIITGWAALFSPANPDVYLIKTDSSGDAEWTRTYGDLGVDLGYAVQQTQDGGYVVTGAWSVVAGWIDAYIIKTDPSGDTLWTRTYGGTDEDVGRSVQQTRDGGYIVAGATKSFGAGYADVYLIKEGPLLAPSLVTGGGWIPGEPHDPGDKRTFGFNVHSEAGMTWGQLQFNDHGTKMRVHSDTIKTLVVYGDTVASFSGDCRVDGVSGYTFDCQVEDRGEHGHGVDKFSVDISGPGGFSYSAGDFLGGGNVQIHTPTESDFAGGEFESEVGPGHDPNPLLNMAEKTQVLTIGQGLLQNSPNPLTDRTTISFQLPASGSATLEIYDMTGRPVATLVDGKLSAGTHSVTWERDGTPSGIYFYRLTAGTFTATNRMVVLR